MKLSKYDEKTLKKLKELELMVLKEFISICEANDLEYFLYGGSALGAVRHNGFIPWDDDIDVIMFQKDYEKFIKIMEERDNAKYELITPDTCPDYFFLFSKLMLKGTRFEEWWIDQVDFHIGINIDIFVLHNLSNNKIKRFFQVKRARLLDKLLTMDVIKLEDYPKITEAIANSVHGILNFLHIKPDYFKKKAKSILTKYDDEDSRLVCDISALNHPQIYLKEDYLPPKKVKFEDLEVNIPNNYDKILKDIYGDYMKIPPEEERYNHAPQILDFGPYK